MCAAGAANAQHCDMCWQQRRRRQVQHVRCTGPVFHSGSWAAGFLGMQPFRQCPIWHCLHAGGWVWKHARLAQALYAAAMLVCVCVCPCWMVC